MAMITVHGTEAMTRRLLELGADAPKAATRAVNRTLASVKTATVRALAQNLGFRNKDVAPSITVEKATFSRQIGRVVVSSRKIPLIRFNARGPEPSRGKGAGVSYKLPAGPGRRTDAFIATMRSGHRGVMVRASVTSLSGKSPGSGKSRGAWSFNLPIKQLFGPAPADEMLRGGLLAVQQANANTLFQKNLEHEVDWITKQRVPAGDE